MSILTYPLNGITYDAEDAETYLCTRTSGVYADEDCFDISITDSMEVTISSGIAWIKNSDFSGKCVCMKEAKALTIDTNSTSKVRYDRIVLGFDAANNETTLYVLQGTAGEGEPSITQTDTLYELGLYLIKVTAGMTALTAAYITDTRLDEEVCGYMSDGVTKIPTATLQAEVETLLEELETKVNSSDYYLEYDSSDESISLAAE